ncbi:MAG: 3-oxoacyl-ACP synthase III [Planctomycetes bacterium]|nr:3-oxoacyl-ACP synthase III [Planctomycetota bacterium]
MRFHHTALAAVEYVLPDERVPSLALEAALESVYRRFGLHAGRLELMTGIRERRFFPPGTRPSAVAAQAGRKALERAAFPAQRVGLLVHSSVCRDFLEPATASVVHDALGLGAHCPAFDLSNACLGFANALTTAAVQIELGVIPAALVVAGECGRALVEETIQALTKAEKLTKGQLKGAFASLTIGSGAAAALLVHRELAPRAPRLVAATARAATRHHVLCHGDYAGDGMLMETDSEALMHAGNELARETFPAFLAEAEWRLEQLDNVITHQVGVAHRKLLLASLGIDARIDFPTVEEFGNVGSVSLPLTLARAREQGALPEGRRAALLGIGSGLQCQMLAIHT